MKEKGGNCPRGLVRSGLPRGREGRLAPPGAVRARPAPQGQELCPGKARPASAAGAGGGGGGAYLTSERVLPRGQGGE